MIARPGKWWVLFSGLWLFVCLLFAMLNLLDSYSGDVKVSNVLLWLLLVAVPPAFGVFCKSVWRMFHNA